MINTLSQLREFENRCLYTFKLISWNVYFKLNEPNFPIRLNNIKDYLSEDDIKPDILFTQESHFDLPESKFSNYTHIYWYSPEMSAVSIHFNNNIFELNSNIIKLGLDNKVNKKEYKEDDNMNDIIGSSPRPILAVKLKHTPSNKDIIFINVWAPHHVKKPERYHRFLEAFKKIITCASLYTGNERIIIAGDFNEFYEDSKTGRYDVNILNFNILTKPGETPDVQLYLKQTDNTCCGSTRVGRPGGLFDGTRINSEKRPFDLLYDSEREGSVVRVETNRMSDHLPISANITV